MSNHFEPSFANGKICYLEIPAKDVHESSQFYQNVFGWNVRNDNMGNLSFDDTTGQVSGMWVTGREPATNPGVLISIMVYSVSETSKLIDENKGKMLETTDNEGTETIARFSDPAGNVFCLYQDDEQATK